MITLGQLELEGALMMRNFMQTNYDLGDGHAGLALAESKREFLKWSQT
jgi:hypothetical protein